MNSPIDPSVAERSHLSIREVLDLLVGEFPDITISKIRFLESRGLIHPERTPSGYRKFYEPDVERLRWILHQQRTNFLPLKVIKGRLEQGGTESSVPVPIAAQLFATEPTDSPRPLVAVGAELEKRAHFAEVGVVASSVTTNGGADSGSPVLQGVARTSAPMVSNGSGSGPRSNESVDGEDKPSSSEAHSGKVAGLEAEAKAATHAPITKPRRQGARKALQEREAGHLTAAELAVAASISVEDVTELEDFALIAGREIAGVRCYGEGCLQIARLAGSLRRFGIEARHMRIFKHAAEREAGLYSQVVMPLLRQRNPEARTRAHAELNELAELGGALSALFVESELRDLTGD